MKNLVFVFVFLSLFGCTPNNTLLNEESIYESYAPDGIPFSVSDTLWHANMRGNHRALVEVSKVNKSNAVLVELPWRRPD